MKTMTVFLVPRKLKYNFCGLCFFVICIYFLSFDHQVFMNNSSDKEYMQFSSKEHPLPKEFTDQNVINGEVVCPSHSLNISDHNGINHLYYLSDQPSTVKGVHNLSVRSYQESLAVTVPSLPVFLFAASANHFDELQGLIRDLHQMIVPRYPIVKLVFFDLGLTDQQSKQMIDQCKCDVHKFPFDDFPSYVRNVKTYAWKPIIIQMMLKKYHFVLYMDASIRLKVADLDDIFRKTKKLGFMYLYPERDTYQFVQHTDLRMFQFFKMNICVFRDLIEKQATMIAISDAWTTHYILMKWWVTCALHEECIAPPGTDMMLNCYPDVQRFSKCHRFDQSALNILVHLIYGDPEHHIITEEFVVIKREERVSYFNK